MYMELMGHTQSMIFLDVSTWSVSEVLEVPSPFQIGLTLGRSPKLVKRLVNNPENEGHP